jgi:hypothetical protein
MFSLSESKTLIVDLFLKMELKLILDRPILFNTRLFFVGYRCSPLFPIFAHFGTFNHLQMSKFCGQRTADFYFHLNMLRCEGP